MAWQDVLYLGKFHQIWTFCDFSLMSMGRHKTDRRMDKRGASWMVLLWENRIVTLTAVANVWWCDARVRLCRSWDLTSSWNLTVCRYYWRLTRVRACVWTTSSRFLQASSRWSRALWTRRSRRRLCWTRCYSSHRAFELRRRKSPALRPVGPLKVQGTNNYINVRSKADK